MEHRMKVEYLSPGDLAPSPHNARVHPPEQIQAIADNIRENGFLRPVLIDKDTPSSESWAGFCAVAGRAGMNAPRRFDSGWQRK